MELFVEPGQSYTFLIELILSYLKLEERKRVRLIALSPVQITSYRPLSRQLKMANFLFQFQVS